MVTNTYTYNLIRGGFEHVGYWADQVLSLQELKLHQHAFHTRPTAAPESVDILGFLHQCAWRGFFGGAIISYKWRSNGKDVGRGN